MKSNLHIIPAGGSEPIHIASPECWCHPLPGQVDQTTYLHNARDCREKFERLGYTHPELPWVLVKEAIAQAEPPAGVIVELEDAPESPQVIHVTHCRRCREVIPCDESVYHDEWEKLCKPCFSKISGKTKA